jgi:hypothetical protein
MHIPPHTRSAWTNKQTKHQPLANAYDCANTAQLAEASKKTFDPKATWLNQAKLATVTTQLRDCNGSSKQKKICSYPLMLTKTIPINLLASDKSGTKTQRKLMGRLDVRATFDDFFSFQ